MTWAIAAAAVVAGMFSALPLVAGHLAAGVASRLQRYALAFSVDGKGEGLQIARDCLAEIARRDRAEIDATQERELAA